jgi:hypothetical protein
MAPGSSDRMGSSESFMSFCSIRNRGYFLGVSCRVSLRPEAQSQRTFKMSRMGEDEPDAK